MRTACEPYVSVCNREDHPLSETLTPTHTALLVMDMQASVVTRFAPTEDALTPTREAIATARAAGIPVI